MRQQRAQITRERLIEAAALTFRRLGYGVATVEDIVIQARASRGALYFHFASKEDLARAVVNREQSLKTVASARIQALNRPAFETMVIVCVDLAERLRSDPIVQAAVQLTTEITHFNPPLSAPYESWHRTFLGLAKSAVREGDFRPEIDPEVFTRFLIPAYAGIQLASDAFSGRQDLLARTRELWKFVMPGVILPDRLRCAHATLDRLIPNRSNDPRLFA